MQHFFDLLENKSFVKWVLSPDEASNRYWENYQKNKPEQLEAIREARIILLHLKPPKINSAAELNAIYPKILARVRRRKQLQATISILRHTLQYAAVAVLFFGIGVYLMEKHYQSSVSEMSRQFANVSVFNGQNARLILTDGKTIDITEKRSNIRYGLNGMLILDEKDTITQNFTADQNPVNQLIVPFGKSSSIVLPDGTLAYLNAGSRLIFPPVFSGTKREVFLVGEGYFDVAPNPAKPFIVQTTDLDVKALGTQFNVSAYPDENKIEVVLTEGKVNASQNNPSIFKESRDMKPNDMLRYNRGNEHFEINQVKTENYTSWHAGYINFESIELSKLTTKLERYYDVSIRFANPETAKKKITGKLQLKSDIGDMLNILASTTELTIIKENEHNYKLN
ncbi:MAG: FecR family protein [Mangrovibacterium sp.]